jgi:transcriptional regulator with XRE-family HTH domain
MGTPTDDGLPRFPGLREAAERRREVVRRLVGVRQELGLSQTAVAARMGTSQSVVARLESGDLDMRLSTLERYAAAVGSELVIELADPRKEGRP